MQGVPAEVGNQAGLTMYIPGHFEESRTEAQHALMRAYPLATLITQTPGGMTANHIPLLLTQGTTSLGALQGHVARANPLWRELTSKQVLAIFQGPHAYITPSWYPAKQQTGRVVPTWNYLAVHAHAELRVIDDTEWLKAHLSELTFRQEREVPQPWALRDAPADYIDQLLAGIVGIEMTITRLEGKWKASQNQSAANRAGVVEGLNTRGDPFDLLMAAAVSTPGVTP